MARAGERRVGVSPVQAAKQKRPGRARPSLKTYASDRLLDDDLDAAVLRLAHTVGGLHQERPASPRPITVIACAGTPSRTRASFTAFARRSDSAML